MMKNFTDELMGEIDSNNMKAYEILAAAVKLADDGDGNANLMLVESALHFVEMNNTIFQKNM